jgi:hypothetical protein
MALESVNGKQVYFGVLPDKAKLGHTAAGMDSVRVARWDFSYDDLPADDSGNDMLAYIPANSFIEAAYLKVGTAWASGTSIDIGLAQTDGTVIDADGIDAAVATASLTADAIIDCNGALVGASVGGNDAVLEITATGTYTAGTAVLEIHYLPLD